MCSNVLVVDNDYMEKKNAYQRGIINKFTCFIIFSSIVILTLAYEICLFFVN